MPPRLPTSASGCKLLTSTPTDRWLLQERVPPGVDQAAYVKAGFLGEIAQGRRTSPQITPLTAVAMLGQMVGGYNVPVLIELLQNPDNDHSTGGAGGFIPNHPGL
jgi:aconitase B